LKQLQASVQLWWILLAGMEGSMLLVGTKAGGSLARPFSSPVFSAKNRDMPAAFVSYIFCCNINFRGWKADMVNKVHDQHKLVECKA